MLEVGLGGRLDATNIVDADVAVVCSIGLDHVDWLGDTLEEIGREKAGIFRARRVRRCSAARTCRRRSGRPSRRSARAPSCRGRDYHVRAARRRTGISNCGELRLRNLPLPALAGVHQVGNAATALAALAVGDFGVELDACATSARRCAACGSPGGSRSCRARSNGSSTSRTTCRRRRCSRANLRRCRARRTIAVCGILGDKDIAGITAALAAQIDAWILVALEGPRAVSTRGARARDCRRRRDRRAGCRTSPSGCRAARARRAARRSHRGVRIFPHGGAGARIPWDIVRPWIREPSND